MRRDVFMVIVIIGLITAFIAGSAFHSYYASRDAAVTPATTVGPKVVPIIAPTSGPTVVPTTYVVNNRIYNPIPTETPKNRPDYTVDTTIPEIDWNSAKGSISQEDIAFWMGKQNLAWKQGSREIVYQKIGGYLKDYRNKVVVKSAKFSKMVYLNKGRIHIAENVSVGDSSDDKVIAYAVTIKNPDDALKEMKMVFYYDERNDDIVAFGYGDPALIITKSNLASSSSSEGGGASGGGDSSGGDTGGAVGGVAGFALQLFKYLPHH
jgi:uncharacterized membrane protein YgcG